MTNNQFSALLLDQTKDLIWAIDQHLCLVFANKAYLNFMKEVSGKEYKLNEQVLIDELGHNHKENWKAYYERGLNGEHFEIGEQFYNPNTHQITYSQISFKPLTDENQVVVNVACQSRDVTSMVKSNNEAEKLLDASLDVFCTIDEKGYFVYVSAASTSLWGYSPVELIGKAYQDFVLEEDKAKTKESAKSILNGHNTQSFANRYRKKDGGIAYNLWSVRWDENTKLHYSVARDGWEKFKHEEKLIQSEQRFKALVQGGSDLYAIIDVQGRYIYMSPSSTAITGIPPEAFIGRDAFEFIHPDDIEQTRSSLRKVVLEEKVVMQLYRAKNQHNEWRWVETVLTNMVDNPAVKGIVINSRDITKEVEEKHQLKLLESVITNTQDAVLIAEAEPLDHPGPRILYVNDAFTKMTGYTAAEVIGKTPRILQGPKSDKAELARLSKALRNWDSCEITTINYKKNGDEFWINFSVTPVADDTGRFTHWIAIERDVTEQKNEALEKDLIDSISDIFHDSNDHDLTDCLSNLCEHIIKFGDFDFAEIWLPSIDNNSMSRVANYSKGKKGSVFYQATKQITSCASGEGLPGHVWKNNRTEIWEIVDGKWLSQRKLAAKKAGFEAMMGVPLTRKDEVLGVLSLGTVKSKSSLTQYLDLLKKLESTIGSELSRKKTEIELAQIFDFTPDLICTAGFDGYIKRMNPAGLAILGYSLEEIQSRPISSFIHEQDRVLTEDNRLKLHNGKNLQNFENRYITKEGKVVWLSWTATYSPEQCVAYAVAKNITEEKHLRELKRQVGELVKIGSWEFDALNNTIFWSDEVHQIYGTDPSSFIPNVDAAINFYREDYRQLALSSFENCISTQEPYAIEAVIINANNKEIWVHTSAKAEFVDGICTRVYGSFQDIDDRKQSEIRFQSFSENLPGVVYQYIIHPDGTDSMQFISGMVEKLWGYTTSEVIQNIDLLWNQIKLGGDLEEVKSSIEKSIKTKSKWTCRFKIVNQTGEIKTHLGTGTPTFLADGTILFHVMVLDITQEAKNEELINEVTQIARVGSWELDLTNKDGERIYWSPMLREIVEVDDSYDTTLTGGIEFHVGESKERIKNALDLLISNGIEFDEEILLRTAKGNERWNRCIGKSETVNGKRIRIYGSYQDIHHRKESQLELLKAIKKLEESDARFKAYTEQSPIGIYITDMNGDCIYANETWLEMAGMELQDALGKGWINALHPDDSQHVTDNWYKSIESNGEWNYEYRFVNNNNDIRWVNGNAKKLFNDKKKLIGFLGSNVDITDRKKAEQEKNNLLLTIENSLNEIYIFDAETLLFTYVNKGAYLNLGYSEEEMKTFTPIDIKPDYAPDTFNHLVAPLVEKEKEKIVFFTNHQRKNGSVYPVEVHLQLISNRERKRFLAIILDITERRKAEEENRFKANLLSTIGQAAIATDLNGIVNYWNKAAENIYGWKQEEALGMNIMNLTPIEDNQEEAKEIMEALKKGQTWLGEFKVKRKNGKSFPALISNSPIYNEQNILSGIIGISSDISEKVKNELLLNQYTLELERSNEELEQFAFVASHDLQEPLRMVSSFMDQLKRKYSDRLDEKGLQYIHFATDGAKRMKQIILDLLLYSRANKPIEQNELVSLNEIVSEYTQLRRKVIAEKSATITFDKLPIIETYRAPITQIFHCLLDNALKYIDENKSPHIEIGVIEKEDVWQFAIKDNGIGIDPIFFDKIFIIFQRLQNRKEHDGTGIGLAIVKRSIEFLGGEVWVESQIAKGSTFYFTISKTKQLKEL